jgi:hypothetical protein
VSFIENPTEKNKFLSVLKIKVKDQNVSTSSLLILSAKLNIKNDPER